MAYTEILGPPKIVHLGGAQILDNTFVATVAGGDWKAGDLLRISDDSGGIEPAEMTDSTGDGGIQLYALTDYDASEEGAIRKPVMKITKRTIFMQQYRSATAPAQTDVGGIRTLNLTTGKNAPTDTSTNGLVTIVDIALNKKWMFASEDMCGAYGIVYFTINAATIDKARTNAST